MALKLLGVLANYILVLDKKLSFKKYRCVFETAEQVCGGVTKTTATLYAWHLHYNTLFRVSTGCYYFFATSVDRLCTSQQEACVALRLLLVIKAAAVHPSSRISST